MKNKIQERFLDYYLNEGKYPASVYSFCKKIDLSETEFYEHYASFDAINGELWAGFVSETISKLRGQSEFESFSVRDKILSFFYAYIEHLKSNRSFILLTYTTMEKPLAMKNNAALHKAKERLLEFGRELMMEGEETREIESRALPQISAQYPKTIWALHNTIIEFWIKDQSKFFEKTDSLIEKSVNTTMDLLGKTPLDSLLDLGKFFYQNKN